MIGVLAPDQALEELDGDDRPAGDVARHLFERGRRTLRLPIAQRVGDEGPEARLAAADVAQRTRPDQRS
ncbi:hypothetical protein [Streptomyces sp.]|uniref:hypothetical protein n=1 Tax=Streptomyces sp. TaxID=1931 RepID=UPI002F3FE116